jgi:hypothetical protein
MHDARPMHHDQIRSRGQLELELARVAMQLRRACGALTSGRLHDTAGQGVQTVAEWFGELADELVSRTEARLAVVARERLKALAARWKLPPVWPHAAVSHAAVSGAFVTARPPGRISAHGALRA